MARKGINSNLYFICVNLVALIIIVFVSTVGILDCILRSLEVNKLGCHSYKLVTIKNASTVKVTSISNEAACTLVNKCIHGVTMERMREIQTYLKRA